MELLEENPKVLTQFAAGELEAFEMLFRQFQPEVYRWIVRIVRDPAAAEDLTVETFWRIYRGHASFDSSRSFGAWARRIATNVAIDYLKTAQSRAARLAESLSDESADRHFAASVAQNPAIRSELRERTQLAFQQLPDQLRAVAALALLEECPHNEIAEALNISTAAVKSRLFRAVRMLRTKLGNLNTENLNTTQQ
jgi:RNA polymerase sigma factor (sigma-70 family)